jgi:lytic murein transglycosylase
VELATGIRRVVAYSLALVSMCLAMAASAQARDAAFQRFIDELWPEARQRGVSRATFDRALKGVEPDLGLPDLVIPGRPKATKGQAEFIRPPQDYLDRRQLARLAENGRKFMAKNLSALVKIEKEIGVERHVVMGIWGRETAYGTHRLPHYAVRVLATQAYLGRRKDMFRNELLEALRLIEKGVLKGDRLRSSWAGAVGLPQFMPSEYDRYAYDLDADGDKDIWGSVGDALASAAQQLKGKGWIAGVPWGIEVRLPARVDCAYEGPDDGRSYGEWSRLGILQADGKPLPAGLAKQSAYLMSPAGTHGPSFLVSDNFKVIRLYNTSDLYAVFVGHLGDRIQGGGDFRTPWRGVGQLPTAEIREAQQRLKDLGYAITIVDGFIGSNTRKQIGLFQRAVRAKVDCWPSRATLDLMRAAQKR